MMGSFTGSLDFSGVFGGMMSKLVVFVAEIVSEDVKRGLVSCEQEFLGAWDDWATRGVNGLLI